MGLVLTAVRELLLALWPCYSCAAGGVATAAALPLQRIGGVRAAMTVPEIDTLRGFASTHSSRVAGLSADPALPSGREIARMQQWPLHSHLELRAVPASVRSARL